MADNEPVPGAAPVPAAPPAAPAPAPLADGAAPTEVDAASGERDDKGRFRNPLQPRIDELTRARREAEREASYWRGLAAANAAQPPAPPAKPTAADFDTYDAYTEALTEWKADQIVDRKLGERDIKVQEQTQAERRAELWRERSAEAVKTIPDLDTVLAASEVHVADHVTAELLDSEYGPHIAHHLDKHPELAAKWNGMSQSQVAKEVGRLEVQFETSAAADPVPADGNVTRDLSPAPAPVQNRRVSSAPPPMKPVGQGRSTQVDPAKLGMDEYVALRAKQGASWAR